MIRGFVSALSAAALAACVAADAPATENALPGIKDKSSLRIALVRTACFGACPMYGVEIHGDGTATYCGLHFVKEIGERKRHVADADLSKLVEQFHAANFLALKDEYAATVTDNPTYEIAISYDDEDKSVLDYVGKSVGMPASVTELEDAIDRIAGTGEWIGDGAQGYAAEWPACGARFGFEPPERILPVPL